MRVLVFLLVLFYVFYKQKKGNNSKFSCSYRLQRYIYINIYFNLAMGVHTFAVIALFCGVWVWFLIIFLFSIQILYCLNLHDTNMGEKGNRHPKDIVEQQESLDCRMRSRRMRAQGYSFFLFFCLLFFLSICCFFNSTSTNYQVF